MTQETLLARAERAEKAIAAARNLVCDARLRSPIDAKEQLEGILRVLDRALNEAQVETQNCENCGATKIPVVHTSSFTHRKLCGVCLRHERDERWSITPDGLAEIEIEADAVSA
jgi:hypothetical protein